MRGRSRRRGRLQLFSMNFGTRRATVTGFSGGAATSARPFSGIASDASATWLARCRSGTAEQLVQLDEVAPRTELLEQLPRLGEIGFGFAVTPERERAAARTGVGVGVLVDMAEC